MHLKALLALAALAIAIGFTLPGRDGGEAQAQSGQIPMLELG
jgi:hypothetical protein